MFLLLTNKISCMNRIVVNTFVSDDQNVKLELKGLLNMPGGILYQDITNITRKT